MLWEFFKYQGAGNDFIMIDGRTIEAQLSQEQIAQICDRHFGVGADGLIRLESDNLSDFRMIYYNSDGKESTMCGNGGRCITAFARDLGIISNITEFSAIDGIHLSHIIDDTVELKMMNVEEITQGEDYFELNTGSPHYVKFVTDLEDLHFVEKARQIRYSPPYKEQGINVNFVEVIDAQTLAIRTYERGVENETLACGTGVVASVLCFSYLNGNENIEVSVHTQGGNLKVKAQQNNRSFQDIWLMGPAKQIFKGKIEL